MRIEAVYDHGRLSFLQPVILREERVRVIVEIPEDAILTTDSTPPLDDHSRALVAALDAIRNAPLPAEAIDDISPKAAERLAAFALRKDA